MKQVYAISAIAMFVLVAFAIGVDAGKTSGTGNGIDLNGMHYNLNLLGKKSDWKGNVSSDSERHTMFVPEDTSTFSYVNPEGIKVNGSVGIGFTRGDEFKVTDANVIDDGWGSFQVGKGTYKVFIACKAKPGYTSDIGAWVYAQNETGGNYFLDVGTLQVSSRKFVDCTDLFMVSDNEDMFGVILQDENWLVFDYLDYLLNYDFGSGSNITKAMYFWDLQNNGNKLLQIKFYPV